MSTTFTLLIKSFRLVFEVVVSYYYMFLVPCVPFLCSVPSGQKDFLFIRLKTRVEESTCLTYTEFHDKTN
jgi:hypothetical protein